MKRGQSGLSLLVAVNKPSGMSSHDVVNACRRIFEEKRVGHTGTLDPLTTGLLPICIGPATKLDRFLTGHDKRYIARSSMDAMRKRSWRTSAVRTSSSPRNTVQSR